MVVHVFHSTIVSGPETLVVPALPRLGVPVTVVQLCESRVGVERAKKVTEYPRSFGLEVREVWVHSRYDRAAIRRLSEVLIELQPTVVHAHDVKASAYVLAASRLAARAGKKSWSLLSTHHGVRGRSGFVNKAYEWFYTRCILPGFDRVLAVCTSDRALLVNRGLDPARVVIHLNGVDRTEIPQASREAESTRIRKSWKLADHGVSDQTILIGFLGRLAPEKRLDRILTLCSLLKSNHPDLPDWKLTVFGTGPLDEELKEMTRSLGLEKQILWMGYRGGVGNELAGFDIVISMSKAEGLPVNLIEAGWGGTPVFATRVDGNLDLVPSDEFGVLVDPAQSDIETASRLAELLKSPSKRASIGQSFQKRVREQFSGARWMKDLWESTGPCDERADSLHISRIPALRRNQTHDSPLERRDHQEQSPVDLRLEPGAGRGAHPAHRRIRDRTGDLSQKESPDHRHVPLSSPGQTASCGILSDVSLDKYVDLITPAGEAGEADGTADFELSNLLAHYQKEYDIVIFDTCAISASDGDTMDPIIVSKTADRAIILVSSQTVGAPAFRKLKEDLRAWGIPILGTVYNFLGPTRAVSRVSK